jgi:hypothetical protein
MLKISKIDEPGASVLLRLEGRIAGPWVDEMQITCDGFLAEGRPLKLNLADVSFADPIGLAALLAFQTRGVLLADCSPFLAEQLKAGALQ